MCTNALTLIRREKRGCVKISDDFELMLLIDIEETVEGCRGRCRDSAIRDVNRIDRVDIWAI